MWLHSQFMENVLHGAGVCGCTHSLWRMFCMELVCVAALTVYGVCFAWSWCVWLHSQFMEYVLHGAGVCGCIHSLWSMICMELVCVAAFTVYGVCFAWSWCVWLHSQFMEYVLHGAGVCGCTHSLWSMFCMELVCVAALTVYGVRFGCRMVSSKVFLAAILALSCSHLFLCLSFFSSSVSAAFFLFFCYTLLYSCAHKDPYFVFIAIIVFKTDGAMRI